MSVGTFFLTDMDPRLRLQGSRDALGSQALWGSVGRRLVGNLTLASNDVAGFRTLLIGYGLAGDEPRMAERLRLFLRWEQVAAGARVAAQDPRPPLGARRVRRRLAERVTMQIGSEPEYQILADQRAAGLWVLYHRAARDSGLVDDRRRLTSLGEKLAGRWLQALPASVPGKVRRAAPQPVRLGRVGDPAAESTEIAGLLVNGYPEDRATLLDVLVRGVVPDGANGRARLADGCQERLADRIATQRAEWAWRRRLLDVQRRARTSDPELATRVTDILVTESVLLPAQAVFDAVLRDGHGAPAGDLAARVSQAWPRVAETVMAVPFRERVAPHLVGVIGSPRTQLWTDAADAMAGGDWGRAVDALVAVNADTMEQRGGAPWVRSASSGRLDVRLPLGAELLEEQVVLTGWRNPYYLTPLLQLHQDLVGEDRR